MNSPPLRKRLSPFLLRIASPFLQLAFVFSIFLYVILSPFAYLYGLLLCSIVWIDWQKEGKDLLVVTIDTERSREWMARLSPLIENRAVFLDFGARNTWRRTSVAAQLFEIFGPKAIPDFFREYSLPCVMVFPILRAPKTFNFGERSKDPEERLQDLRAVLSSQPQMDSGRD